MTEYKDETYALIEAVEALCFALRAKHEAAISAFQDLHMVNQSNMRDELGYELRTPPTDKG